MDDVLVLAVRATFAEADPTWPFMKYTLQMQQNKTVCETELTQGRKTQVRRPSLVTELTGD